MSANSKLWFFRGAGLHQRLTETINDRLEDAGRQERWGHRASVPLRRGPLELHVVRSGGVQVADGSGLSAVRLGPGDVFGELDVEGVRHDAGVSALDDTTILSLPRERFDAEIRHHLGEVSIPLNPLNTINPLVTTARANAPLGPMLYTSPVQRVARVLVHFAEMSGQIGDDRALIVMKLRPGALRRLTGLDRNRLSWALERLRERGLVVLDRHRVILPRLDELRQQARAVQLMI